MLLNIKIINYYENFFYETKLFFLNFNSVGVDLFKKEELISFWTQGFHFYIYSRNNFSVKIVSHVLTYIFFLPPQF